MGSSLTLSVLGIEISYTTCPGPTLGHKSDKSLSHNCNNCAKVVFMEPQAYKETKLSKATLAATLALTVLTVAAAVETVSLASQAVKIHKVR